MTDITPEVLEETLTRVLNARKKMGDDIHEAHHSYVARLIEREKKRGERWDSVKQQVMGWSVVMTATGLLSIVGYAVYHWINEIVGKTSGN